MTGVDCLVCGGPTVWSSEHRRVWCAVWGDHPPITPLRVASHGHLVHPAVKLCDEAPNNTRNAVYARHVRSEARRRRAAYPPVIHRLTCEVNP